MSDSVWPYRRQPTRLPRPWDSPGKHGVGCHFLLQCMKVKSESEVAQSYPTLHNPMDCSLPGSSVYGIFQARGLEWGAIAFSGLYQLIHFKPSAGNQFILYTTVSSTSYPYFMFISFFSPPGYHPQNFLVTILVGGEGNGTPLQYPCLENPMDRGGW